MTILDDLESGDASVVDAAEEIERLTLRLNRVVPWARAYAALVDYGRIPEGDVFMPALELGDLAPAAQRECTGDTE